MSETASRIGGNLVTGHLIGGRDVYTAEAGYGDVFDPATGEISRRVAFAGKDTVDAAVRTARDALPGWAAEPPVRRARVLFAYCQRLNDARDEIAAIITSEHGKTLDDARGEVQRGIEVVEFACGIPELLKGEHSMNVGRDVDSWSMRQPVGVCAGITPFNFPAMVPMWMFPVALACGNTFILKPSEKDPGAAMFLARLLADAGLPAGAFNVVNGGRDAVNALLDHPGVDAVSFVGSTPVAEHVYRTASERGKRVQALGGAKNHAVVLPDANLGQAVNALTGAAYGSAGQRCMAVSVVVAVDPVGDPLIAALSEKLKSLAVGPGDKAGTDMGPLITDAHRDHVSKLIATGVSEGAELVVDGRARDDLPDNGFFLGPTLFDRVRPDMAIYREEIFGPVLSVVRVPDADTALSVVNGHAYGNGAAIFTASGRKARAFAERVDAGMVGVNVPIPVPMAFHSFGGWKRSLFGPLHVHGPDGVRFYTRLKTVTSRWPEREDGGPGFAMPSSDS